MPAEVLAASLFTRFRSRQEHTFAEKVLSAMRFGFGGHVEPGKEMTIVVVMGVSGSGKTTIAAALARHEGWTLLEGDAFHPPANIAKMKAGTPLTDEDRWPWLRAIAREDR